MNTSKFKKYTRAYIMDFGGYNENVLSKSVKAIEVRIVDVKGSSVKGQTLEKYGYIKTNMPNDLKNIVTEKIKTKGKIVDFSDDELVAVVRLYKSNILLTEDEMKLKMVDYIMHDFQTEDERNFNFE